MTTTIDRQAGVTLVELMISLLLGLLIAIGLATLFSQNKRSFYQNEDLARMVEDGRYALEELARDIAMTGFYAELSSPSWQVDVNLNGAPGCRAASAVTTVPGNPGLQVSSLPFPMTWTYALFPRSLDTFVAEQGAVAVADNAAAATAVAEFPCLAGVADLQAGSDVFFSKRVAGAPTGGALTGNRIYVARRGSGVGVLALGSTITASIPKVLGDPLENDWEFQPKVYYVRNITQDVTGDGNAETIPTLCRMVLNAGPAFGEDCIAQGIERFQIEWGVDTDGDGNANAYVSALDANLNNAAIADPNEVVSARIYVLARSVRSDQTYANAKTYTFANMPAYTPNDSFYRRVLSTTVNVRNIEGLNQLAF